MFKCYRYFFIYVLIHLAFCCNTGSNTSGKLSYYKEKYSSAIRYFSSPEDSLKLKALFFILANLQDQYHFDGNWIHAYANTVKDVSNPSTQYLVEKLDSIKHRYPDDLRKIPDDAVITNLFLIQCVEDAFASIKHPWTQNMDFNDFCEYILPYKIGNEKPELWHNLVLQEPYLKGDSLLRMREKFTTTAFINNHLNWFRGTLNYDYPIDATYQITKKIGTGSCYSASRLAAFQMRAVGLPVAIDFAPSWGNRSEGHYWNALIDKGKPYPLDPTGPNIGYYKIEYKGVNRISYKISKVFRQTFSIQNNSLGQLNKKSDSIPSIFENVRIKDVTNEYVPVSTIKLTFPSGFKSKFAFLYTFNDKTWSPCYWGEISGNEITFLNMGRDIVYLPALYRNKNEIIPLGNPFILNKKGLIQELKANMANTHTLEIFRKYPEDESNTVKKGDLYKLSFWDNGWKSLGIKLAVENKLYYDNAPCNALFLLNDLTKGKQERIFTYENKAQIWW